jgi:hypothetical protein
LREAEAQQQRIGLELLHLFCQALGEGVVGDLEGVVGFGWLGDGDGQAREFGKQDGDEGDRA